MSRILLLAAIAAALGAAGLPARASEPFGRLFTTAEERLLLDEARREVDLSEPPPSAAQASATPEPAAMGSVTIGGLVVRSRGPSSTWVDGDRVESGLPTRDGMRVSASREGTVRITLPSGVELRELRPGQRVEVTTGAVADAYQRVPDTEAQTAFDPARAARDPQAPPGPPAAAPPTFDPAPPRETRPPTGG